MFPTIGHSNCIIAVFPPHFDSLFFPNIFTEGKVNSDIGSPQPLSRPSRPASLWPQMCPAWRPGPSFTLRLCPLAHGLGARDFAAADLSSALIWGCLVLAWCCGSARWQGWRQSDDQAKTGQIPSTVSRRRRNLCLHRQPRTAPRGAIKPDCRTGRCTMRRCLSPWNGAHHGRLSPFHGACDGLSAAS